MSLLNVVATTDFSAQALNNITDITFTNAADATATFSSAQFNNVSILNNVHWTGSNFLNSVIVNGGGVDASAWEFTSWSLADAITFNGSAGDDAFVGSRMREIINAGRGTDLIVSGHSSQSDEFHGGRGADTFRYLGFTSPVTDYIDGGLGTGDKIELTDTGTYDFRSAGLSGIETLSFGAALQTAQFEASEFAASGIVSIIGSGDLQTLELDNATSVDLAGVSFTSWAATSLVRILGTSGNDGIVGSSRPDDINAGGGSDIIDAGAGRDIIRFADFQINTAVDGGQGYDTIIVTTSNGGIRDLRDVTLSSVEELHFGGDAGIQTSAYVMGSQLIGTGMSTIRGSDGNDFLYIYGSADASTVSFIDWDPLQDRVIFARTSGANLVVGTSFGDFINLGPDRDILSGGGGDDEFQISSGVADVSSDLHGDGGTDSVRFVGAAPAVTDLTQATFDSVERLNFSDWAGTATVSGSALGGASGIQEVDSGFSLTANVLAIEGSAASLAGITFANWQAADEVRFLGTAGDDAYTGSLVDDDFFATDGADVYDGEGGNDTISYGSSSAGVTVDIQLATASGGYADGDIISDVESLIGSVDDDTLSGSGADNVIDGSTGNDTIRGRAGADTLTGGMGADTLDYSGSGAGVTVSLSAGTASGGDADGDVISEFENVTGCSRNDRITGDSGDNVLSGGGGDDRLNGGNGQDDLSGGGGLDRIVFGSTNHSQAGAATRDTITGFSQTAGSRDTIDLSAIDAQVSSGATDEAFTFEASGAFSGEGQIIAVVSGGDTIIKINTSGNGGAEMEILLAGFTGTLSAADFVL